MRERGGGNGLAGTSPEEMPKNTQTCRSQQRETWRREERRLGLFVCLFLLIIYDSVEL